MLPHISTTITVVRHDGQRYYSSEYATVRKIILYFIRYNHPLCLNITTILYYIFTVYYTRIFKKKYNLFMVTFWYSVLELWNFKKILLYNVIYCRKWAQQSSIVIWTFRETFRVQSLPRNIFHLPNNVFTGSLLLSFGEESNNIPSQFK